MNFPHYTFLFFEPIGLKKIFFMLIDWLRKLEKYYYASFWMHAMIVAYM